MDLHALVSKVMERNGDYPCWGTNPCLFNRYSTSALVSLLGKYRHVHLVRCLVMIYTALCDLFSLMTAQIRNQPMAVMRRRNKGGIAHQAFGCTLFRNKDMAPFLAAFDLEEFFKFQDSPFTA